LGQTVDVDVTVTGVQENVTALQRADNVNVSEGSHQAALALLPYVEAGTRVFTGVMRGGWMAGGESFLNLVDYSPYQEYGTVYVAPTHAIGKAIDSHPEALTEPFEKVTDDAIRKAGFSR